MWEEVECRAKGVQEAAVFVSMQTEKKYKGLEAAVYVSMAGRSITARNVEEAV
jgi:hypothetical protein